MNSSYDDIIHLPRHVSKTRPRMSIRDRAAQFSPFAALTGHNAAIVETARLTDARKELSEDAKDALLHKLNILDDHSAGHPEIVVTYFLPDEKKSGGSYLTAAGALKKLDDYAHMLVMLDGTEIPIVDILDVECVLFGESEQ